ncbi:MAG: phosphoglycerate kinase [Saprospiraceae bacterium]|nr:phosphoglycerate kinase [Candidatus Defluviibacterium haderslevense]
MKRLVVKGKVVLLRVDFNVPINSAGEITDENRIEKSIPTIQNLLDQGAKLVIMSHLGRPLKELLPNGDINLIKFSLKPVAENLQKRLKNNVQFATDCGGPETQRLIQQLKEGEVLLLENTRFYKGEEKGDAVWAESLSKLGSFYINDAFGAAHREHATTATIARFFDKDHKAFGLLMDEELEHSKKITESPEHPLTAIIGGAKVSDKIELISNLIDLCDTILIGGGMAYTFFAAQGYHIGTSLCELDKLELAKSLIQKAQDRKVKLILPLDSVTGSSFSNESTIGVTPDVNIPDQCMGLDIGPKTIKLFSKIIHDSKTIVWNGPMGVFEMSNFEQGTKSIALAVAEATYKGCFSLIGGGDSVAAINKYHLEEDVSYVSTGGGAMLELLEGKTLPGVAAILS